MNVQKILGIVIMLMVAPVTIAVGAVVVFETTGSIDYEDEATRSENTTQFANTTFTTIDSVWENDSGGDNNTPSWDDAEFGTGDNAVWDNVGAEPAEGAGASWTHWWQSITVPAHDDLISASITGDFIFGDNTEAENVNVWVYLQRPALDNITILSLENTSALWLSDNATWIAFDNTLTDSTINDAGEYTLFLCDNIDRREGATAENWVGIIWDNVNLTIETYQAGYLENAIGDVESQTDTGFGLGSLVPLIVAAIALITIIVVGFVGMRMRGASF